MPADWLFVDTLPLVKNLKQPKDESNLDYLTRKYTTLTHTHRALGDAVDLQQVVWKLLENRKRPGHDLPSGHRFESML